MIEKRLDKYINNEKRKQFSNYTLNAIEVILDNVGNPHNRFRSIHIAGTNGKGSVANLLQSIFSAGGYKTGLFTSPHLLKPNERITINQNQIPEERMLNYLDQLEIFLDSNNKIIPTYFDIFTLFGFRYFYEENVDIAIIETGLGGRLDSTNIINPDCSIITDISKDHTHILGNTLKEIAYEKGGIIKKNIPVITSNRNDDVIEVISSRSQALSSPMYLLNRDFNISNIKQKDTGYIFDYNSIHPVEMTLRDIHLNQEGPFQCINSSLAITAVSTLNMDFPNISNQNIYEGIMNFKIKGRLETINKNPLTLFDPAHNKKAITSVIEYIREKYPDKKITVVLSLMSDKDYKNIIKEIKEKSDNLYYYELTGHRCYKPSKDKEKSIEIRAFNEIEMLRNEIQKSTDNNDLILFLGSFQLYSSAHLFSKSYENY